MHSLENSRRNPVALFDEVTMKVLCADGRSELASGRDGPAEQLRGCAVLENLGDSFVEERVSTAIERGEFPVFRYEPEKMDIVFCVPQEGSCWLEKKLLPILDEFTMSRRDFKTGLFPPTSGDFAGFLKVYRALLVTLRQFDQRYGLSLTWESLVSLDEAKKETDVGTLREDRGSLIQVLPVALVAYDTAYWRAFGADAVPLPWGASCWACRAIMREGHCLFPFHTPQSVSPDGVVVPSFSRYSVEVRVVWAIAMMMVFLSCLKETGVNSSSLSYYHSMTFQACAAYLDGVEN